MVCGSREGGTRREGEREGATRGRKGLSVLNKGRDLTKVDDLCYRKNTIVNCVF